MHKSVVKVFVNIWIGWSIEISTCVFYFLVIICESDWLREWNAYCDDFFHLFLYLLDDTSITKWEINRAPIEHKFLLILTSNETDRTTWTLIK